MKIWTPVGLAGAAVALAVIAVTVAAGRDVRVLRERLQGEREVAQTTHGPVEYVAWGEGPAVLVIHGAGGGFDQGRLIAEELGGEGFRWIAPSRFGYLGSPLPEDASTAAQADAFAELLDQLGLERVTVMGFSGGVPPALQLAARHPDRVSALMLLSSAPFTPFGAPTEERPIPDWLYQALFGSDAVYWSLTKVARGTLEQAFDARPELVAAAPEAEQGFPARVVDAFLPASDRIAGVRNEGAAIDPQAVYALETIRAPTLVVHARDDRINPFGVGETIAARVPGAELVVFERGGHLLLGHHAALRSRISDFAAQSQ